MFELSIHFIHYISIVKVRDITLWKEPNPHSNAFFTWKYSPTYAGHTQQARNLYCFSFADVFSQTSKCFEPLTSYWCISFDSQRHKNAKISWIVTCIRSNTVKPSGMTEPLLAEQLFFPSVEDLLHLPEVGA